jgi:translocation and assembly module TamB
VSDVAAGNVNPPAPPAPRRRWRWLIAALALPLVIAAVLVLVLFKTSVGRDLALGQLRDALGPGALAWGQAEGHLSGGLRLHDVRYAADGVKAGLALLDFDLDGLALLSGTVRVRHMKLSGGRIELPAEDPVPAPWPERIVLPAELPTLALPIAIRIDALEAESLAVQREDTPLFTLRTLSARAALVEGIVTLEDLRLTGEPVDLRLDAHFDTVRGWAGALDARADLALAHAAPVSVEARLSGTLDDLSLTAQTVTEPANRISLRASGGLPEPRWNLEVDAPQLRPPWFGAQGEDVSLALQVEGDLAQAALEGTFRQGGLNLDLLASQIAYDHHTLTLAPLALGAAGGRVTLEGDVGLAQSQLALVARWADLTLAPDASGQTLRSTGETRIDGPLDDYALTLDGDLRRSGEKATLALAGRGSNQALTIETLRVDLPSGRLDAHGRIAWEPQLEGALELALSDFDPSWVVADLPGSISARISASGAVVEGTPRGQMRAEQIGGTLRGQPLRGAAAARMEQDGSGAGQLDLRLGGSRLAGEGRWGERIEATLDLSPLRLSDWLDAAEGELHGTLALSGLRDAPELDARIDGSDLAFADQAAADHLALRARLGDAASTGTLSLEARGLDLAGQAFDLFSLSGEGDRGQHRVELALVGPPGRIGLTVDGTLSPQSKDWRGVLQALALEPREHAPWRLREPAAIAFAAGTFTLEPACLDASPASLCLRADSRTDATEGALALEHFDLAQLTPWLDGSDEAGIALEGQLDASAQFTRNSAGEVRGQFDVQIPSLVVKPAIDLGATPFALVDLHLAATLDPAQAALRLDGRTPEGGRLRADARLAEPGTADGQLSGALELRLPDISSVAGFSEQVAAAQGRIEGHLALAGTRSAPQVDGTLALTGFAAQLPALGISLHDGELRAQGRADRGMVLEGSLGMGEGVLEIAGEIALDDGSPPKASATLRGENLTVMAVPEARVRASPDLSLTLDGDRLNLRGKVAIPFARIDLERLQSVRTPSHDVVIVDEAADRGGGVTVDADIGLALGEDVRMNGFGLNGTLAGQLRVRDRPGMPTTARGSIDVGGAYKAYGQDLSITRGRVAWAATPIDTPALDVRAQRKIDAITVGVQVRGTALVPELTLWSDPAMDQAEQLSYLVLGRPLRSASQADGAQLSQAAAAFGGNLLAKNLGAQLGVDEIEVADNRALGGAALTVGKKLSPRLHVSYGVALFGPGQVVTFKYLLSRLLNIQIDSGTENRAALNYRLER